MPNGDGPHADTDRILWNVKQFAKIVINEDVRVARRAAARIIADLASVRRPGGYWCRRCGQKYPRGTTDPFNWNPYDDYNYCAKCAAEWDKEYPHAAGCHAVIPGSGL